MADNEQTLPAKDAGGEHAHAHEAPAPHPDDALAPADMSQVPRADNPKRKAEEWCVAKGTPDWLFEMTKVHAGWAPGHWKAHSPAEKLDEMGGTLLTEAEYDAALVRSHGEVSVGGSAPSNARPVSAAGWRAQAQRALAVRGARKAGRLCRFLS